MIVVLMLQIFISIMPALMSGLKILISKITFWTTNKSLGPYGETIGLFNVQEVSVPNKKLAFITGSFGARIDSISFYFI